MHTIQHRVFSSAQVVLGIINWVVAPNHGSFLLAPFTFSLNPPCASVAGGVSRPRSGALVTINSVHADASIEQEETSSVVAKLQQYETRDSKVTGPCNANRKHHAGKNKNTWYESQHNRQPATANTCRATRHTRVKHWSVGCTIISTNTLLQDLLVECEHTDTARYDHPQAQVTRKEEETNAAAYKPTAALCSLYTAHTAPLLSTWDGLARFILCTVYSSAPGIIQQKCCSCELRQHSTRGTYN